MPTPNIIPKDYESILIGMILAAQNYKLISDEEDFVTKIQTKEDIENVLVLLLSAYALEAEQIHANIEEAVDAWDVSHAEGTALDSLGELFGLYRNEGTRSFTYIEFRRDTNYGEDIEIPAGTLITCKEKPGIEYQTIEDVVLESDEDSVIVGAMSLLPGSAYRVGPGELNQLEENIPGIDSAFNTTASSGGKDPESDEAFRQRILRWPFILQKGTLAAYEDVLNSLPGLTSYQIFPRWDGPGTVKVVVNPPYPEIINDVEESLRRSAATIDEDLYVVGVEPVSRVVECRVTISAYMTAAQKKNIEREIEKAAKIYFDGGVRVSGSYWEGLGIGESIVPFKLAKFVSDEVPEVDDVEIIYPTRIVKIQEHQKFIFGSIKVTIEGA